MIDTTTLVAVLGWAFITWAGVVYWRQVRAVREWARAHGLPLTPPASRMRLARALEGLEPTMSGLWDGAWVHVWTRPMWMVGVPGWRPVYRMKIRVVNETPPTRSVQAPPQLGTVLVRDGEVLIVPWGGVPLDQFAAHLSAAVAHARARSGLQSTIDPSART